jgi:UDP-N-acetyl-2-amino-2-deoxyglucuronate dehydrogenase
MKTAKIKFGVIGQGHIGKRHAEMVRQNPNAELMAVCDIQSSDSLGLNLGTEKFYTDIKQLLEAHPEIDVINVCSPNGLHAQHCIDALNAGKHVVCEKPMALSKADCEKVIFTALQNHRQVFVVMQNRYSPPSVWLKEMVDKKTLGEIFLVEINCFWNRDERYYTKPHWKGTRALDGGTLFTQFSHFIDIMYWVFGDISDINARFGNYNHQDLIEFEDTGIVSFKFTSGGMGILNYTTSIWNKNMESSITVIGSNGSIKVGGQYMDKVEYCHVKDYTLPELLPTNPANDYGSYKGSANNHPQVIQNVIDTLNGINSPSTNAMEGLKVVEIIERIYKTNPYVR